MKSPFPGMDPYLEDPAFWEDFHRRFITALADYLLDRLPDTYDAHIDERVRLVASEKQDTGTRLPDISIDQAFGEHPPEAPVSIRSEGSVAVLEPVALPMLVLEEHRDVWLEIVHLPERRLITAIEIFSPSNKQGDDAAEYQAKRLSLYSRHVNLVEIDLLRGGQRLSFARPLPRGDYYAFVTENRQRFSDVYAWGLRDRLPRIPVPLQSPDPSVELDLATVFAGAYERGRYRRRLRYSLPVRPALNEQDAAWATHLLKDHAKSDS